MINIRRAPSATFHARTFLPSLPPPIILNSKNLNVLEIHLRFEPEAFCVPENPSESILLASRLSFSKNHFNLLLIEIVSLAFCLRGRGSVFLSENLKVAANPLSVGCKHYADEIFELDLNVENFVGIAENMNIAPGL